MSVEVGVVLCKVKFTPLMLGMRRCKIYEHVVNTNTRFRHEYYAENYTLPSVFPQS